MLTNAPHSQTAHSSHTTIINIWSLLSWDLDRLHDLHPYNEILSTKPSLAVFWCTFVIPVALKNSFPIDWKKTWELIVFEIISYYAYFAAAYNNNKMLKNEPSQSTFHIAMHQTSMKYNMGPSSLNLDAEILSQSSWMSRTQLITPHKYLESYSDEMSVHSKPLSKSKKCAQFADQQGTLQLKCFQSLKELAKELSSYWNKSKL